MKRRVEDLLGAELDCAVAEALGYDSELSGKLCIKEPLSDPCGHLPEVFRPSTRWDQGGLIIEQQGISLTCHEAGKAWSARVRKYTQSGPSPLIAAMRACVAGQLGLVVEIRR